MEVIFLAIIYYSLISLLLLFSALNSLQFANRYSVSILKWNKTGLAIFTIDALAALIVISYAFLNSLTIMLFIFGLMLLLNLIFVFVPSIKDIMLTSEMLDEENAYLNDISTAAIYVVFVVWLYFGT
tara:strand:- start:306 stop:686 length:381 start_codon:yes stop_codon:yes gene_type:complete